MPQASLRPLQRPAQYPWWRWCRRSGCGADGLADCALRIDLDPVGLGVRGRSQRCIGVGASGAGAAGAVSLASEADAAIAAAAIASGAVALSAAGAVEAAAAGAAAVGLATATASAVTTAVPSCAASV